MITRVTVFTVVFILSSSFIFADDPCRFEHTRGVLDLTSVGLTDGTPKYANRMPPTASDYQYSYNPCKSFNQGPNCQNVAACQSSLNGLFIYALATQETAQWNAGDMPGSGPSISYSSGEKKLKVLLECSNIGVELFEALGEEQGMPNNFKYRLTHKCACWNGCGGGPPPQTTTKSSGGGGGGGGGGGVSGGTVFVILLLVLVFVYFVGFAVFYRFRHQRSGAELIPHRTFWVGLPGYVRDGAVYTYRRVANKGGDPYQSV